MMLKNSLIILIILFFIGCSNQNDRLVYKEETEFRELRNISMQKFYL